MTNSTSTKSNVMASLKTDGQKVIEINSLKKSFDKQEVLKDVSLKLFQEENLAVLGKSGSGKSVLIKCIVRLMSFDEGTIEVLNKNVTNLNDKDLGEMRKQIGFLFQSGALYDSMTVKENLEFPLKRIRKELTKQQINDKVMEVLANVKLVDSLNKMPSQLSGGMRKRISLARTIIVDPIIMFYDEPTTGLDPVTSVEISLLINELQKKYKTASIIITHDIECAKITANRLVMLSEGEVHSEGSLQEFEQSDDPLIKAFFK